MGFFFLRGGGEIKTFLLFERNQLNRSTATIHKCILISATTTAPCTQQEGRFGAYPSTLWKSGTCKLHMKDFQSGVVNIFNSCLFVSSYICQADDHL